MSDQPAAGWYVDPTHRFDHRYWDGTTWTEHVSRNGRATTDPLDGSGTAAVDGTSDDAAATAAGTEAVAEGGATPPWQGGAASAQTGTPSWQGGTTSWQDQARSTVRTNTKAILSLVASLIWFGGLGAIAGIVLGTIAKREIRERPDEGGAGIATAGIVIGVIGVIGAAFAFLAFIALFATGSSGGFSLEIG